MPACNFRLFRNYDYNMPKFYNSNTNYNPYIFNQRLNYNLQVNRNNFPNYNQNLNLKGQNMFTRKEYKSCGCSG